MGMIPIDGTFDIECADWDRFIVGITLSRTGVVSRWTDIQSMTSFLLGHGGTWWSHCGGRYDMLAVLEELRHREIGTSIAMSSGRVSRAVCQGLVLRDSYALVPMGLDRAIRMCGRESPTLETYGDHWRCDCSLDCGGYCRISRRITPQQMDELASYCRQDCVDLRDVLCAVQSFALDYGLEIKGTIGGSAYATAKKMLLLPDAKFAYADWSKIRSSYFGGRVTVCRPIARGPIAHYDLSSAYPAALASLELPTGDMTTLGGKRAYDAFLSSKPGVYSCEITIPQCYLPSLPVRSRDGRISYPYGVGIPGTWALPELKSAITRGVRVTGMRSAIVWSGTSRVFDSLFRRLYSIRRKIGKESAFGEWISLFAKSISGKLAESPRRENIRMFPFPIRFCKRTAPCSRDRCSGLCGAYRQIDKWGQIWASPYFKMSTCSHIHWAAYCTATTRVSWLDAAESQGEDLIYGDTDSIWTSSRVRPTPYGSGLGQWTLKGTYTDAAWTEGPDPDGPTPDGPSVPRTAPAWQCAGPKVYRYWTPGGWASRTAGIASLTDEEWSEVESGGHIIRERGVRSFSSAAALGKGLFVRDAVRWSTGKSVRTGIYGDRVFDADSGLTYPRMYGADKRQGKTPHRTESG